jgi:hypothetical protein
MATKRAPGTCRAEEGKISLADLPYEMQRAIFDAATGPEIIFMRIKDNVVSVSAPIHKGLALACRLSREIYLKSKVLSRFGSRRYWVDPDRDLFYLDDGDPIPRAQRPDWHSRPASRLKGDIFDPSVLRHVAVDLEYMGSYPFCHFPLIRIWTLFPKLEAIHIFVPKGPPQTPAVKARPGTLRLEPIPSTLVVAAPRHDKELWLAVRYQVRKVCTRILETEHGWNGRTVPQVVGHLTSLWNQPPEDSNGTEGSNGAEG